MNRIFRKVWNKALGRLVVTSELASRQRTGPTAENAAVARSVHNSVAARVALVAALLGPPLDVLAGNGIHINANAAGNCVSLSDPQVSYVTGSADAILQAQLRDNLKFSDGAVECNSANKASQTGSVLFYRPAGVNGTGATSLTLGGELHVNGTLHLNSGIVNAKRLAMGLNASAIGATDWALGEGAQASGDKPDPDNTTAEYGFAMAFGNNAKAMHTYATSVGPASEARGARSTALGASTIASGHSSLAMGRFAQAIGHSSAALGRSTIARAKDSLAMGYGAQTGTGAEKAVALGANAIARGTDSLAMGSGAQTAEVVNAIALGVNARGNAADAVAIGVGAVSDVFGSVALGTNAKTTAHRAVATTTLNGTTYSFLPQGLSVPNVNGVVSVGSAALSRQIINVAPGVIDATSYDAVNGSQLFAAFNEIGKLGEKEKALVARDMAQQVQIDALLARPTGSSVDVASIAQAMGVPINPNGTLQLPTMDLKSLGEGTQQPQNLVDGIKALDAQLATSDAALGAVLDGLMQNAESVAENAAGVQANSAAMTELQDKLEKGELGLVQQDAGTRALTVGKDADGARVDVSGKEGARTVDGLKDARLTADSSEAVTGAQLKTTNDALAGIDARVASNRDDTAKVAGDVARNATELALVRAAAQTAAGDAKAAADTAQATATTALAAAGKAQAAADAAKAAAGAVSTHLDGLAEDSLLWNKDIGAFDARHGEQATSRIGNVAAGVGTADAVNVGQLRAVGEVADAAKGTAGLAQSAAAAAARDAGAAKSAADTAQATAAAAGQKADTAGAKADAATTAAAAAGQKADNAVAAAAAAGEKADVATAAATAAGQKADTAVTNATAAGTTANEAKALAEAADRKADTAGIKADAATTAATAAGQKADSAVAAAGAAGEKADAATAAATTAGQKADTAVTNATAAGTTANEAKALAEAADRKADTTGIKADAATTAAAAAGEIADSAVASAATANTAANEAKSLANTAGATATAAQASANQANAAAAVLDGRADATDESLSRLHNGTAGLVQQDQATREITVAAHSDGTRIQVAGSEGSRTMTGLRDGRIAADSTDAVTGSQANALAQRLDRLDMRGNGIQVDGTETGGNAAHAAVGSGAVAIGTQAVAEHRNSVALGANARTDREDTVSVGSAGAERQITHVAPATQDTDAVNLRQTRSISQRAASQAVAQANAYTDNQMQRLRRETKAGIAVAMAAAGLPLNGAPGARSVAVGGATYGGESALALGLQTVSEDGGFIFKASGSMSADGDSGASVGVGFSW